VNAPVRLEPKLFIVMVTPEAVAVNLYQTLYAVPLPQPGAGAAADAFLKLPIVGAQVLAGVRVDAPAQLACE
jgi:hypothetical protein